MTSNEVVECLNMYFKKYNDIDLDVYQSCAEVLMRSNPELLTNDEAVVLIKREIVRMEVARFRSSKRFRSIVNLEDNDGEYDAKLSKYCINENQINAIAEQAEGASELYLALLALKIEGRAGEIFELLKQGFTKKEIAQQLKISEALVGYYTINKLAPLLVSLGVVQKGDVFK